MSSPGEITAIEAILDRRLQQRRPSVLARASQILGKPLSVHQFHAIIGGKNNIYADCVRTRFADPQEFSAVWLDGLMKRVRQSELAGSLNSAAHRVVRLLKSKKVRRYTLLFQRRNFYRNFDARVRAKPPENLWSIWFGSNEFTYGLLIAPVFRKEKWTNDKSQMRREPYMYWTVGHVLDTGLIDLDSDTPLRFPTLTSLMDFYSKVLRKVSKSKYEKRVAAHYVEYLRESDDAYSEPFLIPEFRYGGVDKEHRHRIDFTVFNSHTMSHEGFELSPHSTHMAVKKVAKPSKAAFNRESSRLWAKEVKKRNDYYTDYEVPITTFADEELQDMEACFKSISRILRKRPKRKIELESALKKLKEF